MGCISVSTGIHTKHSRDLKITALKPMLVQWRSWSREYICSKGRITWIDESQVVGANLMFLFFFSLSAKVELLSWKQERKCVTDKVRSETFTRTNTKEKPSLQIFFQTLVYESLLQKKKMKQFQPVYILIIGFLCTLATSHRSSQAAEGHIFERANYNTRKICRR